MLLLFLIFCFKPILGKADLAITLSERDKKSLTEFFHAVLWGSEVGYVLYGEKPICIEPYHIGHVDLSGKLMHHLSTSIAEGVRIWKKLPLPSETSEFVFLIKENSDENEKPHSHIIFINKKAFHKVFSNHSSLFRYALGPELTADKLLKEIKNSKQNFFSFFKNDKVLIGILLGFGLENSLYVGRFEQLLEILDPPKISKKASLTFDDLVIFKGKHNKKFMPPFEHFPISPSLGYSSLAQEFDAIGDKIDVASDALENYSPNLIFGKAANCSDSTCLLINSYQQTQLKIINVLDHSQWLEQILSHFYGEPVKIFIKNEVVNEIFCINREMDLSQVIAQAIFNRFNDELEDEEINKFSELIKGMKEAEKRIDAHYVASFLQRAEDPLSFHDQSFLTGFRIWSYYKFNKGFISLSSVIHHLEDMQKTKVTLTLSNHLSTILPLIYRQIFENINDHENSLALSHFQNLENMPNSEFKCLEKNRLYYQRITPGVGAPISKDQLIRVSYTLKTMYGNIIEDHTAGAVLDLNRTIKAFRISFPLMRIGEQGILFIYPEWGVKNYLSPPYFSPYLIAEFNINEYSETILKANPTK